MSAARIPPDLEPLVFALDGRGLTSRQIAAELRAEHGLSVHHSSVARLVRKQRAARAEAVKGVVRDTVGRAVEADLALLARETGRLEAALPGLLKENLDGYLRSLHTLCRVIATRFDISREVNPKKGKRTLEDLLEAGEAEGDDEDGTPGGIPEGRA
ncbi:MAG TPA: hypothetical protein VFS43_13350 [Polyangiaceae bacterium]|nr:hypothetical protein [Polyangiaceae bacterium]